MRTAFTLRGLISFTYLSRSSQRYSSGFLASTIWTTTSLHVRETGGMPEECMRFEVSATVSCMTKWARWMIKNTNKSLLCVSDEARQNVAEVTYWCGRLSKDNIFYNHFGMHHKWLGQGGGRADGWNLQTSAISLSSAMRGWLLRHMSFESHPWYLVATWCFCQSQLLMHHCLVFTGVSLYTVWSVRFICGSLIVWPLPGSIATGFTKLKDATV